MERVSLELVEVDTSRAGYRYILTMVDHLIQLVPLRKKVAATVSTAIFEHWICLFGPPRVLQTDGGAEFQNRLLAEICHHLRTRTALTTAHHPQANGMIERTNRVVKDALAATAAESPQDWEQMVPQVRLALNSAFHRSVQETPLYLLTGQEAHFPVGLTN